MKNKQVIYATFLVFCAALLLACAGQKGKHKLADKYVSQFEMQRAAEIYEDILAKDSTDAIAYRKAAECRMNVNNNTEAESLLSRLVALENMQSEDYLSYAEVLKRNKKYLEAVEAYKLYTEVRPDDPRVYYYFDQDNWLHRILRDSSRFDLSNSEINSIYSDFAPAFIGDNIYFASARGEGKGANNIYAWNDQSYLNLYEVTLKSDSTLENARVIKNKTNSRYHEGSATYDAANQQIYFTRNNYVKGKKDKSKEGQLNLGIFIADYNNGDIQNLRAFANNNEEYSVGHPTISKDGSTLYFSSDMPGGVGGADLYKCLRDGSNWGKPENLGPVINTGGDEMFPFLLEDNLYFSSDGHPGLGGLDVFYTPLASEAINVTNIGYPISTEYDDFGILLFDNGKRGFVSSNRPGGIGDDDIWDFTIEPITTVIISGQVLDKLSSLPIENAKISIKDLSGNLIEMVSTDAKGKYSFESEIMDKYDVTAVKEGYLQNSISIEGNQVSRYLDDSDILLSPSDYGVGGRVLYAENDLPAEGAQLKLFDENGVLVAEAVTGPDGKYSFGLESDHIYTLECIKFGYPDQEIELDTKTADATMFKSDFRLFKMEEGTVVRLDNIYYDYDKWEIRSDAAIELNKLVTIMEDNPSMTIELGSHTDSRGSPAYNSALSQKRAQAVVDYLTDKGVAKNRIKSKGYGESKILNKCVEGVECSEDDHQLNRRTEFKILKI